MKTREFCINVYISMLLQWMGNTDNSRGFSDRKYSWSCCFCAGKLSRECTWALSLCHGIIPVLKPVGSMAWVLLQLTKASSDNAWMCCKLSPCQDHEQQKVWVWTPCFVEMRKTSCKDTDCIMITNVPNPFNLHRCCKWEEKGNLLLEMFFVEEYYSLGENYTSVRRLANISLTVIRFCIRLNWKSLDQPLLFCHVCSLWPERNEECLSYLQVGSEKDTWSSVCMWSQKKKNGSRSMCAARG